MAESYTPDPEPTVIDPTQPPTPPPAVPPPPVDAPALHKKPKPRPDPKPIGEVVFHTYPKLLFIWPLIVAGFAFWPLVTYWDASAEVVGWVYLCVVAVVLLTVGIDLERDHAVFWLVTFLALFFAGKYLDSKFGETFTLLGNLYRWLADLNVRYDPALGLALSLLMAPPYLTMLVWARLQHRWRITHNEFEHYSWGRADDSLARGAKRVRSTFPDLLELLLCGAGTLVVYSATGRTELRRIPHVPLIFLVRRRLNLLLEATSVTTAAYREELYEAEADAETEEDENSGMGERQGIGRDPL